MQCDHAPSVMSGRVILTTRRVFLSWHNANELHHAAVFMGQDVTVKYERAVKVRILLSYCYRSWDYVRAVDLRGRYGDYVLPDEVASRSVKRFGLRWGKHLDYLKRINVDVEGVSDLCGVVLQHPILQPVLWHTLIHYQTGLRKLLVIDHEVGRIGVWSRRGPARLPLKFHRRAGILDVVRTRLRQILKELRDFHPRERQR